MNKGKQKENNSLDMFERNRRQGEKGMTWKDNKIG